jgi:hypothetical protein
MKIYCDKCNKFMGNILSGSELRNGIVYLCTECHEVYKVHEDLASYSKGTQPSNDYKGSADMPDFFKDIFKGK